jgi:nonsense-mediated mRNA decay protein 3
LRFCVKCGKEIEKALDGCCSECYLNGKTFTTAPHHVDLEVCAVCGEFLLNGKWVPADKRTAVEDAAVEKMGVLRGSKVRSVSTYSEEQDPRTYLVKINTELAVEGSSRTSECSTVVRIKNTVCKRCSRVQGNYYESILQIRSEEKAVPEDTRNDVVSMIMNYVDQQSKSNRQYFVTKVEEMHGGADIYLSSITLGRTIARMISDMYSGETKESAKLVGRSEGQDVYRITYLVRLPEFRVGDVVTKDGKYYKLGRILPTGGRLISLKDFKEINVRRADMPLINVYRKESELPKATVVSSSPSEVQVLHPTNYSTVDLKIPRGASIGDTVRVIDIDGLLYYVP